MFQDSSFASSAHSVSPGVIVIDPPARAKQTAAVRRPYFGPACGRGNAGGAPRHRTSDRMSLPSPLSILSIQSHVVYGHVGNSAAVFPLQRHRLRGMADQHGAVLQPHRLSRLARPSVRRGPDRRLHRRHRRARRAGPLRRRPVGLYRLAGNRRGDPARRRRRPRSKRSGGLLLRSRARRCRARRLCARRRRRVHARTRRCPPPRS